MFRIGKARFGKALPVVGAVAVAASLMATPAQAGHPNGGSGSGGTASFKAHGRCGELIKNGSFERPTLGAQDAWALFDEHDVRGWRTDDTQNKIEIWGSDMGVQPKHGEQFVELNATSSDNSIYQDIRTRPNTSVYWSMWIRARDTSGARDVEATRIHFGRTPGGNSGSVNGVGSTFAYTDSAGDARWKRVWGWYKTGPNQHMTRVTITAASSANTDDGYGNLVDMVSVTERRC